MVGGRELATRLADSLGCTCVSREDLTEQAIRLGVPVGKLQMAMVKPPRVYQRMGRERDQYLACMTMLLCERILKEDIVYYGHAAQMLLCGVPNILRVRVLAHPEFRIASVIHTLGLSREKAKEYIQGVDEDREKWVRFLYGVDWSDPAHYDLVVHLDQMGLNNAATAVLAVSQLPDFKLTPASTRALRNLYLGSKAHFALSKDPRTSFADMRVTADEGTVQVTYLPQESEVVPHVREVLASIEGIKDISTTIARSSVLFLQDEFDRNAGGFGDVLQAAERWDAAVELMRFAQVGALLEPEQAVGEKSKRKGGQPGVSEYNGGIEDDGDTELPVDQEMSRCLDELRRHGCSGGSSTFCGDPKALINRVGRANYSMIVLGDLFKGKSEATRIRLRDELKNFLSDNTDIPVVDTTELKEQFRFGPKQVLRLVVALTVAVAIFVAMFTHQEQVIGFLAAEEYHHLRWLAVTLVVVVVPVFAMSFGTFTREFLKLFKLG